MDEERGRKDDEGFFVEDVGKEVLKWGGSDEREEMMDELKVERERGEKEGEEMIGEWKRQK